MTGKRLILVSVVWTVLMVGVGLMGVWYVTEHPVRGSRTTDRANRLGSGVGALTVIGYAVLWLPYAAKVGKRRRAERAGR